MKSVLSLTKTINKSFVVASKCKWARWKQWFL